jgi:signal transduction histidine kinase/ActR/RegA family two-component response regulator
VTPVPGRPPLTQLESLEREILALDEQVKLLVRTEARLTRLRHEQDLQLSTVEALANLAVDWACEESTDRILGDAARVLGESLSLDRVCIVRAGDPDAVVCAWPDPTGEPPDLDAETRDWVCRMSEAGVIRMAGEEPPGPETRAARALAATDPRRGSTPEPGALVIAPFREPRSDARGALIGYRRGRSRAPWGLDRLGPGLLPLLSLLARLLEGALESARLTRSLRHRGEELAASVQALESMQQELVQVRKLEGIGRLAGGVAHEFNNLLTVILGHTSALLGSAGLDGAQREGLTKVMEAGQHASAITSQLLAFGRRQVQRRERLDLCELTEKSLRMLQRLVGDQILKRVELDRSAGVILADRTQVMQVLLNLVLNARDAMPSGGTLRVTVRPASATETRRAGIGADPIGHAALVIEDDGRGMDEATRERAFEPFFTTKGLPEGTGLGLAVVYGIVRQNDGHVLLDTAPGEGTRCTVIWPLAGDRAPDPGPGTAEPPASRTGTVIVVEDEDLVRGFVASALGSVGHDVYTATDGEQALRLIEVEGVLPDLVITDAVMPRMGGLELTAALRQRWPALPVIVMSGFSTELLADGPRPRPPHRFLQKPFEVDVLIRAVASALAPESATAHRA